MSAVEKLMFRSDASQPIRVTIDASSHMAGLLRGVVFAIALLTPVIATAFGPAVRQPYKSEVTRASCVQSEASGTAPTECEQG